VVWNEHEDLYHARVDKDGRILGVLPISGTGKFSVDRVASLDLAAMTASFAAREQSGAGMGMLSPRDTVRVANAGGAALWIDYGRPGKRGREIYGSVVPYGAVWRTGANAATQFKTDKALDFGGTVVPADDSERDRLEARHQQRDRPVGHRAQGGEGPVYDRHEDERAAPGRRALHHLGRAGRGRRHDRPRLGHDAGVGGVHGQAVANTESGAAVPRAPIAVAAGLRILGLGRGSAPPAESW
jgi:hypothetical protein